MIRLFAFAVGGQKCKVCHKPLRVEDGPHSHNDRGGRFAGVQFTCPGCCPICASNAAQQAMEAS